MILRLAAITIIVKFNSFNQIILILYQTPCLPSVTDIVNLVRSFSLILQPAAANSVAIYKPGDKLALTRHTAKKQHTLKCIFNASNWTNPKTRPFGLQFIANSHTIPPQIGGETHVSPPGKYNCPKYRWYRPLSAAIYEDTWTVIRMDFFSLTSSRKLNAVYTQ